MNFLIYRCLALACAILAGWALGRSNPGWDSDMEGEVVSYPGDYHSSLRLFGGNCLAGTGAMAFFGIMVVVCYFLGWPGELPPDAVDGEYAWFMALFSRPAWLLGGSAVAAYVVARLTDKGPAGPLE